MASPASSKYADGPRQHPRGIVAAPLAGWTLLPISLWGAALGGIIGVPRIPAGDDAHGCRRRSFVPDARLPASGEDPAA